MDRDNSGDDQIKNDALKSEDDDGKVKVDQEVIDFDDILTKKIDIETPSGPQCYCMNPRDFNVADFQCSVCYKWFHLDCIAFNIGKSLPFLTAYHFMCRKCNSNGEEVFSRKQANFAVMCQTALANLMWRHGGRLYFFKEQELIPFLEEFWEELTTQPRKSNNSWYPNIHKTLDIGKMGPSYDRFRALTSQLRTNITKLGVPSAVTAPASQCQTESGDVSSSLGHTADSEVNIEGIGWRKRKSPGSAIALAGQVAVGGASGAGYSTSSGVLGSAYAHHPAGEHIGTGNGTNPEGVAEFPMRGIGARANGSVSAVSNGSLTGSLVRSTRRTGSSAGLCGAAAVSGGAVSGPDEGRAKLNALGFPVDHPFNKEGYRYILVEPDKHASGRGLWDECEHTAGKPIPGLFYRVFISPKIVISVNDRANHLKLHESQLMVTGEKGYCMARATHGVHTGTWYYEAKITEQPEGSTTRIGWSQRLGSLQAPCGYDKFSYSWRSRPGSVFHQSRGKHYDDVGYKKDDVVGCMIHLPTHSSVLSCHENTKSPENATPSTNTAPTNSQPSETKTDEANATESTVPKVTKKEDTSCNQKTMKPMINQLPETYKDRPLIKFRNSYYFEEKDEPSKAEKLLRNLPASKITFYRNGESLGTAFGDIHAGLYYPAISIYRAATVSVNFGPVFKHPPPGQGTDWHAMADRPTGAMAEQTLSDMLYLVEKDGIVEQLIRSYSGKKD